MHDIFNLIRAQQAFKGSREIMQNNLSIKSIQTKTSQDHLEGAQVILESLEGLLLQTFVSYDQCDLSDDKAKAMLSVCEVLANGALEDIESASAENKISLSTCITQAHGIAVVLSELSRLILSKGYTAAAIHGLFLAAEQLNESLESAVDAVIDLRCAA